MSVFTSLVMPLHRLRHVFNVFPFRPLWSRWLQLGLCLCVMSGLLWAGQMPAAQAGLNDDRFDGDIFALYAGNGSLIPPKMPLNKALQAHRPAILVLYTDDSRDCKQYSVIVSQLQAFYGRAAEFVAIRADSFLEKGQFAPTEPGYYYKGFVPQTVIFDAQGKVRLNEAGILPFERVDDVFREVFDLLPRSESVELKRRTVNEISTELVKPSVGGRD